MLDVLIPLVTLGSLGAALIALRTSRFPRATRVWLLRVVGWAFVLRLAMATVFQLVPATRVFHEDSIGSENYGIALASYWKDDGPEPTGWVYRKNPGYPKFLGACYFVFGRYRVVGAYVSAIIGVLATLSVAALGLRFFHPAVVKRAVLMLCFVPSMVLWQSMSIKDPLCTLLIVWCLSSFVELRDRFSVISLAGVLLPLLALHQVRFYLVYFLLLAVFASLVLPRGLQAGSSLVRNLVIGGAIVALLVLVGFSGAASEESRYFDLANVSSYRKGMASTARSGFAHDVDISTPGAALVFFPYGLSVLLLGPFPWQFTSFRSMLTMPEMLLWWSLIPAMVRGLVFATRRRFSELAPLVVFLCSLTAGYSLMHGNVGSGFRQRAQIFVFLFLVTALGQFKKQCQQRGLDDRILLPEPRRTPS